MNRLTFLYCIISFVIIGCNNDNTIINLLTSTEKDKIIRGSKLAGESKNEKFVPFLLENSIDWRTSTSIGYKGVNVYQAKMEALREIYKKDPPNKIDFRPDSSVINFYKKLYESKK